MAKYIKSHSNYRLSTRYQDTANGTILERDMSTIGGVDSFGSGQSTIYSSGNFIITVNNDSTASRHVIRKGWLSNSESGDTWNAEVLENYTSDVNGSVEKSIAIKNDFMDLRSFSCYGSLYNLIQTSITDILDKYPYEIFTGNGGANYNKHTLQIRVDGNNFTYDGYVSNNNSTYSESVTFYEAIGDMTPASYVEDNYKGGGSLYEISNPASIDIHTTDIDELSISNPLQYFANGGYLNYSIISDTDYNMPVGGYDITWDVARENVAYVTASNVINGTLILHLEDEVYNFFNIELRFQEQVTFNNIIWHTRNKNLPTTTYYPGDILYIRKDFNDSDLLTISSTYCPISGDYVAKITLGKTGTDASMVFYAIRDENTEIKYVTTEDNFYQHIRPKESLSFYDNFIDSLDLFQKCLMGVYSGTKNVAKFEILSESKDNIVKKTQTFTFPTTDGDYNLDTGSIKMAQFIQNLAKIGLFYDENYTDNLYRLVTHESLKNFDWTKNFNGNDSLDNEYTESGDKFKSVIRIMGYVFDKEKMYIDCIGNTNTVTYDNRSNLSDYFLSDALYTDGWIVNTIYPYNLREFDKITNNEVFEYDWSEVNQTNNTYHRKFSENTIDIITPYSYKENGRYWTCSADTYILKDLSVDSGQTYVNDDNIIKDVIRDYQDDKEITIPEINNEFLKRLKINSRQILRKKGTVECIESILGLFGFRSKRWCNALGSVASQKYKGSGSHKKFAYDFDVVEYTSFTSPIHETWDLVNDMYSIDYYNSCKTIPYNTQSYLNGEYISYQGLPIAYRDMDNLYICSSADTSGNTSYFESSNSGDTYVCRDVDNSPVKARRLYPNFDSGGIYDGDMYYQMNGGWLSFWPFSYNTDYDMMSNHNEKSNKETLRNVSQVNNLESLLSQSSSSLIDGSIFYVNDISTNYAVIDGQLYELFTEVKDDTEYQYFNATVLNGSVTIGDNLYSGFLTFSTPYTEEGIETCYLPSYNDGQVVKIYYMSNNEIPFTIFGYDSISYYRIVSNNGTVTEEECDAETYGAALRYDNYSTPENIEIFLNGSLHSDTENYTNYFKLNNSLVSYLLSDEGWTQLSKTDTDYVRVSSIIDEYEGNNPHSGGYGYDNGYEYMSRYSRLFEYALNNDLIDDSCFIDSDDTYTKIYNTGFSGLTSDNVTIKDYTSFLYKDTKVHSFCDVIVDTSGTTKVYNINDNTSLSGKTNAIITSLNDGVTNQILNTKVVDIIFYLSSSNYYSKACQEEIKYIQDKVMPYVEQILPSTLIIKVKFYPSDIDWIFVSGNTMSQQDSGATWTNENYWLGAGKFGEGLNKNEL